MRPALPVSLIVSARLLFLGAMILGCTMPAAPPGAGDMASGRTPSVRPETPRPTVTTPALAVSVREATYGRIVLATRPAAQCDVTIALTPGQFGDRPSLLFSGQADATGRLEWIYAAPPQPAQLAEYLVSCRSGGEAASERSSFSIAAREPNAAGFTVRVAAADPSPDVRADPPLVALRDALLQRLRSGLAADWSAATRGLGHLRVVDEPADVLVKVIAARSASVHRSSRDGSQEILIHMADDDGVVDIENLVATTLHELGHVWCCTGPDAESTGHWAQAIADPELAGVDRFGLMNHPVKCTYFGAILSCPNRFSRRELVEFGFTAIPPPPPDACLAQAGPLEARSAQLGGFIAAERAAIEAAEGILSGISARIAEIERRYGRTLPPDLYEEYNALVARYNSLLPSYRTDLAQHNAYVAERNQLVSARTALPC